MAPRRLAQLSWKRVGRLAGWLAPKLHRCPLSSIAPVQCAPQLTDTQRVYESARTTRGAARGRSSPVPSWPHSLCPQVSTSPTLVTHATCSSPIATARIEWHPSPGWRRGVGHRWPSTVLPHTQRKCRMRSCVPSAGAGPRTSSAVSLCTIAATMGNELSSGPRATTR